MIRIAMIGSNRGNGHPYSWSAILNGYDPAAMREAPYPRIAAYLADQTVPALGGARVTHIWSADRDEAERVARTCLIDRIVDDPRDVLGSVDAVIVPTDDASAHHGLTAPFLEAGLPVLVDKPLALAEADLDRFAQAAATGGVFMSCSALRFSPRLAELRRALPAAGAPVLAYGITRRGWATYGVHLVEALAALWPDAHPVSVRSVATAGRRNVIVELEGGAQAVLMVHETAAPLIHMGVCGTERLVADSLTDWFEMFREMLRAFLDMVVTRRPPIPFDETRRIMRVVIAAEASAERGGTAVPVLARP